MPLPPEYQRATDAFYAFLQDAKENAGLGSSHQAYTMSQAVLQCFRRRLSLADGLRFAQLLPVGLRALFVADWDPEAERQPFADEAQYLIEIQGLRKDHNFSPETARRDVARALRSQVDLGPFEAFLNTLGAKAQAFWAP